MIQQPVVMQHPAYLAVQQPRPMQMQVKTVRMLGKLYMVSVNYLQLNQNLSLEMKCQGKLIIFYIVNQRRILSGSSIVVEHSPSMREVRGSPPAMSLVVPYSTCALVIVASFSCY